MNDAKDAQKDEKNEEDVSIEEVAGEESRVSFGAENAEEKIKKLKEKLKVCETERQEYLNGWQRAKADFVNMRKDEEKMRGEFLKFAKEDLFEALLPVLDSFEMAFANKEAWEKVDLGWRQGVEYIHSQLEAVLGNHGFDDINPLGKPFDVHFHVSVASVPVDREEENGVVVEVLQKGYVLHGKVMRPAKVKVGEFKKNN